MVGEIIIDLLGLVFGGLLVLGLLIAFLRNSARLREQMEQHLHEARDYYQQSLAALKRDPGNGELRERALGWGREYARRLREGGRETLFDEVALMNDINAATGGTAKGTPKASTRERLRNLANLRKEGLKEYMSRREAILRET